MEASLILLSGAIVIAGRFAQKKPFDLPAVIALFFLAVMISILTQVNQEIGRGFAILVLVAVGYVYGQDILNAINKATGE